MNVLSILHEFCFSVLKYNNIIHNRLFITRLHVNLFLNLTGSQKSWKMRCKIIAQDNKWHSAVVFFSQLATGRNASLIYKIHLISDVFLAFLTVLIFYLPGKPCKKKCKNRWCKNVKNLYEVYKRVKYIYWYSIV